MSQFPQAIPLPDSVFAARKSRKRELAFSIVYGMVLRLVIIAAEFIGFAFFDSSSLFLDGIASLLDVLASGVLLVCVQLAARPPDREHPFGHGRYEPLAGLQLSFLLIVVGGTMIVQQIFHIVSDPQEKAIDPRAWLIPFCAVILLEIGYQVMRYTAKKNNSSALAADAVHFRLDALNSLFAAAALLFAVYLPQWSHLIDHVGAILIAALMVIIGLLTTRHNLDQLMDHIPPQHYFDLVKEAAMHVAGVCDTEKIAIQLKGPDAHVNIDVEVDPEMSVDVAHRLSQQVRVEIQKAWPVVRDVSVHIEPYYPGDHR